MLRFPDVPQSLIYNFLRRWLKEFLGELYFLVIIFQYNKTEKLKSSRNSLTFISIRYGIPA